MRDQLKTLGAGGLAVAVLVLFGLVVSQPLLNAPPSFVGGTALALTPTPAATSNPTPSAAAGSAPLPAQEPPPAPVAVPQGIGGPKLVIPPEVRPSGQYVAFVPDTDAVSIIYVGLSGIDPLPPAFLADKRAFLLDAYGKPEGRYLFTAVAAGKTGDQTRADFAVLIGTAPPVPPPGPGPGPSPGPGPAPKPDGTAPIPHPGFRVLMVAESAEAQKYPPGQLEVLYGRGAGSVYEYLQAKTVKGVDGRTGEFRIWDKDTTPTAAEPIWAEAMDRVRNGKDGKGKATELPWLVVSDGKAGWEGPLPKTTAETLALLKKYGG